MIFSTLYSPSSEAVSTAGDLSDFRVRSGFMASPCDSRKIKVPILGTLWLTAVIRYANEMRVITKGALQLYWNRPGREDAKGPLQAWYAEAKASSWKTPADIKARYRSASFVGDSRVIFNIGGNKHRLVVHVNYALGILLIKFIGSHEEYDAIDASSVGGGRK